MNKKLWIGFVTVFVTTQVLEGFVNFFLLDPIYSSYSHIWRPISEMKLWMLPVTGMFFSFFFVFIFSKGYEGKGISEGIRYGFYVALWLLFRTLMETTPSCRFLMLSHYNGLRTTHSNMSSPVLFCQEFSACESTHQPCLEGLSIAGMAQGRPVRFPTMVFVA
ncbi:hypothetical protein D4R75_15025 [bacterium]|nr:MAG: hypothetical protein D4R75_15025 [bacterium]